MKNSENTNNRSKALIYIRVSTDEQANKGYSLRDQEDNLRKHCLENNIEIVEVIKEDYSAKTFDRPAWKTMMLRVRKGNLKANELLFIKWDRFSRNTEAAYSMITTLQNLELFPQAIEQKIDFAIPEQRLLLALYLTAPEVENLRKGINVRGGMRKKLKEGEWPGRAPKGYKNITLPNGKRTLEIDEKEAPFIRWAFEQFVTGTYQVSELRDALIAKGFKLTKNRLYGILRTEFFCGRIHVPPYQNEKGYHVIGKHIPLISENLYEDVQDLLLHRKRKLPHKVCAKDEFPLRGFLICNQCNRKLTSSPSTGRAGKKYYYYHCYKGCKERLHAFDVNKRFEEILKRISFTTEAQTLYETIIKKVYAGTEAEKTSDNERIKGEIKKIKERMQNAQNKLLDGLLEDLEYRDLKKRFSEELKILELNSEVDTQIHKEFEQYLKDGLTLLKNIGETYSHTELHNKQRIIGSIFPEMLTFSESAVRTTRVNEVLHLISPSIKDLGVKIKRDESLLASHPHQG